MEFPYDPSGLDQSARFDLLPNFPGGTTFLKPQRVIRSATPLLGLILLNVVAYAQSDVLTKASGTASTTAQTIANDLGIVVLIIGLITAAVSKRVGAAFMGAFLGAALAVAPKIYTSFQAYFS